MQGGNAQNKKRFIIVSLILILSLALPCFATVTESSGDGFALYNGVKLPNIDSVWTDKETYQYACLGRVNSLAGDPLLFISSLSLSLDYNGSSKFLYSSLPVSYSLYYISGGVWTLLRDRNGVTGSIQGFEYPIWSNYELTSSDLSTTYLAASTPIPLDGFSVIEWDGDTSGLVTDGAGSYQVSPYFPEPGSAYTVWSESGSLSVSDSISSLQGQPGSWFTQFIRVFGTPEGNSLGSSAGVFFSASNNGYVQTFAYRESETEGPTGAVTGLNIITPPLGETDYIVYAGSELQCTALVTGTGDFNPAVTWSLSHSSSAEYYPTISETGLLSVLPGVPEQRIFITATSVADPSIYATVPVYIMPPAVSSVTITPSSATAAPGQNIQFSATVSGSNVEDSAVTWAVGGASSASTRITRDGLLLIGSDEVSPVIAVRATSDQDGSVYGTALVTINIPAAVTGVTITPDDIVLNRGDVQHFTATVSGTGSYDNSVTWQITSVYSAGTSISNTGLLTIGEEQKYDYIIIKATSTADPSMSATAYVFVEDAISDPMNIDLSVVERLLEEIKNYLKTLQHIFDRPHYFREFNMYTGKLNEQEEQITGLTFNFYRFMQNMEEYVGSIAYTFANGAEVQIREDTTEGFDWFSLFFGKDSGSKVEKSDFAGISTIVTNTRDLFDTGFGFSDFFELIGSVPFFTDEVASQLDTTVSYFDVRDPDPFNMSVLGNRDEQLEEWRSKHTD